EVVAAGQLPEGSRTVGGRDEQLVGPEVAVRRPAERDAEDGKDRFVEAPAGVQIPDDELDVIDQTATVQFLRLHLPLLSFATPGRIVRRRLSSGPRSRG